MVKLQLGEFFHQNTVAKVNLPSHNLIACRLVRNHVYAIGGLENLTIAKELVLSARAARKRYLYEGYFRIELKIQQ